MHPYQSPTPSPPLEFGALALRTGLSLALVIGLIYLTALALRALSRQTCGDRPGSRRLRLLQTLPLGGGRFLHLLAVGNRVLVIGGAGNQTCLLAELSPAEVDAVSAEASTVSGSSRRTPVSPTVSLLRRLREIRSSDGTGGRGFTALGDGIGRRA